MKNKELLKEFNIIDFCLKNYYNKSLGGGVYLAEPFKELHDRYGWKYADIHTKFRQELSTRLDEVYITRASDAFVRGAERKQLPIYHNQWYSHLMKRRK